MDKVIKNFGYDILVGVATFVVCATITWIFSIVKDIDFISAWHIINVKVDVVWFIGLALVFYFYIKYLMRKGCRENDSKYVTKKQLQESTHNMVDLSQFKWLRDTYDYRRLKNHPKHNVYTDYYDNVRSFIIIINFAILENDSINLEYGLIGLIAEIKEHGHIDAIQKEQIMNIIDGIYTNCYNVNKENLKKLLESVHVD